MPAVSHYVYANNEETIKIISTISVTLLPFLIDKLCQNNVVQYFDPLYAFYVHRKLLTA
jgi:hypothetical protein